MKKYLYLAATLVFALCSCTSEEDVQKDGDSLLAQNVLHYGTRSSSVDVLIGSKTGFATRGCDVNGNMWASLPDYPENVAEVMAYIGAQKNPESVAWPGYTYYYIQHVGGAHHKYSYEDFNHAKHDNIDGTASMEFLQVLENSGNWQHVYNFNAGKCDNAATHNAAAMSDGFNGAKTLNEYSSSTISKWCLFIYEGEYYLGFDFDAKKGDGEIPGDGIYDDWVVKIIPGAGEKTTPKDEGGEEGGEEEEYDDPTIDPETGERIPEVEVDVHHQQHKDWNEVKTSIHLRDTVNVRVFIPVDKEYQAVPDDFDIRTGGDYTYLEQELKEVVKVKYVIASTEFEIEVQVNHKADGIEMLIGGAQCAEALKLARGFYNDGITFEIHSYLYSYLSAETIWNDILKKVELPGTSHDGWPQKGSCVTRTRGQIHSAYYEEELIPFDQFPEK